MKVVLPRCKWCGNPRCRPCPSCDEYTCHDCLITLSNTCEHEAPKSIDKQSWKE